MPVSKAPLRPVRLKAKAPKTKRGARKNVGNLTGDMKEYNNSIADANNKWWDYTQCASNRIRKGKKFYHPQGTDFHELAVDYNVGPDDCGVKYESWLKEIEKINMLAERIKSDDFKKLDPTKYYWGEQTRQEIEDESQQYVQQQESGSRSPGYLPILTDDELDDESYEDTEDSGEEPEATGPNLLLIAGIGLGVLVLAGGGYYLYRRRQAAAEDGEFEEVVEEEVVEE